MQEVGYDQPRLAAHRLQVHLELPEEAAHEGRKRSGLALRPVQSGTGRLLGLLGITEKGYSPAKVVEPDGDFYMATTLNSAFKGFSKVPSAADIEKKHKSGKALTAAEQYMEGVIKRVEDFIKKAGGNREEVVKAMIEQVNAEKNQYQRDIAQMKFAMLVSRKWFADSESFDDNVDTVHSNYGVDLVMEYRFGDKKVNL